MINFYKNKKILITGNTGFKGSWLTLVLLEMGAKVIGYSNSTMGKTSMFELLKLEKKIKFIKEDIRDFNILFRTFNKYKPECVFHLAAQSLVLESYKKPLLTFDTNVLGSSNLLECCRLTSSVKTLIYVTSDKCYEDKGVIKRYSEKDRLGGDDPYSSSKTAAENVFRGYYKSFFKEKIGAASVRSGNVIGGGDWSKDRLIPDCVRVINSKKKLLLRNPNFIRPWQHVLDPIFGYLILNKNLYLNKLKYSGNWNFGPNNTSFVTVKRMTNIFFKNFNTKVNIQFKNNNNKKGSLKETKFLLLNSSKSLKILKWKQILNSYNSIFFTSEWYKEFFLKKDLNIVTKKQIRYFLSKYKSQ
jgi:CDP-glucose 4,6-dehydratase